MTRRRRVLLWILVPLGFYALLCLLMWVMQDRLIFVGATWGAGEPLPFEAGVEVTRVRFDGDKEIRVAIAAPSPLSDNPRPLGVAVLFGGNGEDLRLGGLRAQMFAEYRLVCFAAEYPGYGESDGEPGVESFYAAADAVADVAAARARELDVPLYAIGVSLGSFSAVHLAREGRVAGLLLAAPPTSLSAGARLHYPWLPVGLLLRHRFDNLEGAERVTCPVRIVHGTRDKIVPLAMGEALAAAFPNAELFSGPFGHNDLPLDASGHFGTDIRPLFETP